MMRIAVLSIVLAGFGAASALAEEKVDFAKQVLPILLHGDAALGPLHDEDEIEIAVTDFADRPGIRLAAELCREFGKACEIGPQVGFMQDTIGLRPLRAHDYSSPDPCPC